MYNFIRTTALVAVLMGLAVPAAAATQSEFYANLLRRGVASYEASRYPDAAKQLRIAAFGMVDAVEQYQLAQVYLTLTYDKLGLNDRAREAAHRVTVAERVQRKYASLPAPQPVRTSFEVLAARLLTPGDMAILRNAAVSAPVPQVTPPQSAPAPQSTPPQVTQPQQTSAAPAQTPPQTAAKPPAPKPQPVTPPRKPAPENVPPQTAATTKPVVVKPAPPAATTAVPAPAPAPRTLTPAEISARLTAAHRALTASNLPEARRIYREVLALPGVEHASLVALAEGLYRARDFAGALNAFARIGTLRRGEEPYRYYISVAAYETGDYARAKKELAAALPFIEITPDVARYRTRIEGAQ